MRILSVILLAISLAGCERVGGFLFDRETPDLEEITLPDQRLARPVFVVLETDAVIVVMDDQVQCQGPSRGQAASGGGWTGTLKECPYRYTYAVQLAAGAPSGRIQLQEVFAPPLPPEDGEVPFRPLAAVIVTDSVGQSYRFETPEGF